MKGIKVMSKMKLIIQLLENYQKILKIMTGNVNHDLAEFLSVIKPYKDLNLSEFQIQLQGEPIKNNVTKKTGKDYQLIAQLYRLKQNQNSLSMEDEKILDHFLDSAKEKKVVGILNSSLKDAYQSILEDKGLTEKQLVFLGDVLLGTKLKGSKKQNKKDDLLQLIWKTIENQKMNEIYESR